ncbi:MAG: 16S rRNA (uracil(1498)-N(3))-methyltransferase [Nitrosomonadales bacterium]|nr:MAG: 16S rRNA (uracil(1498)-N(3))-methyltransferase [Nitrosomonadales bacterium]
MPIPRFYCPLRLGRGQTLDLPPDAAHHAAKVLRMEAGHEVALFSGEGGEYTATITHISKNSVTVKTTAFHERERESPLAVTLAQAISSGDKMDYTLQKAVELGITHIQPLSSERSVVKLAGERADKRVRHWQQVVISACEQCGRNRVPEVAPIQPLLHWLGNLPPDALHLMLAPDAQHSLGGLPAPAVPVTLLIGPEGGLSPSEIRAAESRGFTPVRLGPRVLRTETAALAALAAMQTLWGDFKQA